MQAIRCLHLGRRKPITKEATRSLRNDNKISDDEKSKCLAAKHVMVMDFPRKTACLDNFLFFAVTPTPLPNAKFISMISFRSSEQWSTVSETLPFHSHPSHQYTCGNAGALAERVLACVAPARPDGIHPEIVESAQGWSTNRWGHATIRGS